MAGSPWTPCGAQLLAAECQTITVLRGSVCEHRAGCACAALSDTRRASRSASRRWTLPCKFCFCKNNKRTIIISALS